MSLRELIAMATAGSEVSITLMTYRGGLEHNHTIICTSATLCYNDMSPEKVSRGASTVIPRLSVRVTYKHKGTPKTEIFDLEKFFAEDPFVDSKDPTIREKLKLDANNDALYLVGWDTFMNNGKLSFRAPYFICPPDSLQLLLASRIPHKHYMNYVNSWSEDKITEDNFNIIKGATLSTTPLSSSRGIS